ncbi:leucine--tRNA ligase [Nanoarchaeota archaeon]
MLKYNEIEKKWQKKWEESNIFKSKLDSKKKKFYVMEMFPYPSGSGLHMGHARNYVMGDVYARFKRMQGLNVLYPMGYDSLGLPAENAAIKAGVHPKKYTDDSIKNFIKQQKELGLSYDWERMIKSHDPSFYKWDQWIFLKMFEKGIAFRKKAPVNWCPECNTVLANEQVHSGKCWRHKDTDVSIKHLEQWFLKITDYADELNEKIDDLTGWADDVKAMQRHWIGKSHGTEIIFKINKEDWPVFTTRPDTLFGVTFMVISAQHPKLMDLVTKKQKPEVEKFLKKIKSTSEKDMEDLEKEGAFTGAFAINPMTGDKIPVYTGNFVLAEYGSGMVMAVPAHDQRDFEFAKKYEIPIKIVIQPTSYELNPDKMARAYTSDGNLINSEEFDGSNNRDAIEEITKALKKKKLGKKTIQFKLRDWLVSRQRYWGTPIPVIYCDKCGIQPVPEKELPIELPEDVKFGDGNPLKTNKDFVNAECPKCKGKAKRETDTMDTFVNSSWYFLRYCDPKNNDAIFDKKKVKYWMPIDIYIGGKEHACMHLIYFRFYTKFLRDIGMLDFDEPTTYQFNQGMLHGPDGAVMSKSRGNIVLPEKISKQYGIDTARLFLMFVASPEKDMEWSDKGVQGTAKFMNKVIAMFEKKITTKSSKLLDTKINKTIKQVKDKIDNMQYNLAIIDLMEFIKFLETQETLTKDCLEKLLLILSPFCPHVCEELWEKLGNKEFISQQKWPKFDESKIDEKSEAMEDIAYDISANINDIMGILKKDKLKQITLIVTDPWKIKMMEIVKKQIKKSFNVGDVMKAVMKDDKLKKHGKDIQKIIPRLLKKQAMIPKVILSQSEEIKALENKKDFLKEQFDCKIIIEKEKDSTEQKASQAMPGKPAIIVE